MSQKIGLAAMSVLLAASAGATETPQLHGQVPASADIYGVTGKMPPGATRPPSFAVPAGAACLTFEKVHGSFGSPQCAESDGCITVNADRNYNDPDGNMAQVVESSNSGHGSISGMKSFGAGYLVGLFTNGIPAGGKPARLDFTKGTKRSFTALSPLLDQSFFVGDGRRKDNKAVRQFFTVPAGATTLYLGISDTCHNFNGPPGCYADNLGYYKVAVRISSTACPTE